MRGFPAFSICIALVASKTSYWYIVGGSLGDRLALPSVYLNDVCDGVIIYEAILTAARCVSAYASAYNRLNLTNSHLTAYVDGAGTPTTVSIRGKHVLLKNCVWPARV